MFRPARETVLAGSAVVLSVGWHARSLALPPHAEHSWRDADGIGVARGFLTDGWNILIEVFRGEGAAVVVESVFGGWLTESARAHLGPPHYADDQVRSYLLR